MCIITKSNPRISNFTQKQDHLPIGFVFAAAPLLQRPSA